MVREYESEDYETICEWLRDRDLPPPPRSMLPKIGFIVDSVCCVFLYQTDSDTCRLENLYSNKKISKGLREFSIDEMITTAITRAQMLGYQRMHSVTDHPEIIKRAVKLGSKLEINKVLITTNLKEIKCQNNP